jgi:hypothetical protein
MYKKKLWQTITQTNVKNYTCVIHALTYGLLSKGTDTSYRDVMRRWTGKGDLFARSDETRIGSDENNVT